LIENHPDSELFRESGGITIVAPTGTLFNEPADYERAKVLWQQQANRFSANVSVLSNAAEALCNGNPEISLDLMRAARRAEPKNEEWTRWLAKVYADAIRWSFWDGKTGMTFTGDQMDYYRMPFKLPDSMADGIKKEMETTSDAALVRATGDALVRQTRMLRERGAVAQADPENAASEAFGQKLQARAQALGTASGPPLDRE
jgi:hypothetical protein